MVLTEKEENVLKLMVEEKKAIRALRVAEEASELANRPLRIARDEAVAALKNYE